MGGPRGGGCLGHVVRKFNERRCAIVVPDSDWLGYVLRVYQLVQVDSGAKFYSIGGCVTLIDVCKLEQSREKERVVIRGRSFPNRLALRHSVR